MKVLIVAVSAPAAMTGVHRHAINLARCLLARRCEVHLVVAPWQSGGIAELDRSDLPDLTLHIAEMKPGRIARNLWHCFSLPRLVRESGADIVHLTCPVPFLRPLLSRPIVVTLHDLYPIEIRENFGRYKSAFNRAILHVYLGGADAITTVSDRTLAQLRTFVPAASGKAVRIYNCVQALPPAAGHSPLPEWRGYPFLLCVGQHRRNKNIDLLLRAFHRLVSGGCLPEGTRLVILGVIGPETGSLERTVHELGLESRIVCLAGLSDAELHWCYRNAKMLVAPSQTEGFGFPVAEALQTGCRVVCSDIPTFREIGGSSGRYFSLEGDAETNLVEAILDASTSQPPAPVVLERFSTRRIGAEYELLYRSLYPRRAYHVTHEKPYENKL